MKNFYSTFSMLVVMVAALGFATCSSDDDNGDGLNESSQDYDVLQINGERYACYGYRSIITYSSSWDFS